MGIASPSADQSFLAVAIQLISVQTALTVAIPTLRPSIHLDSCLAGLAAQNIESFSVVVIDNSGRNLSADIANKYCFVEVINNSVNIGFGSAINQALLKKPAKYLGVLNDDAVMRPGCLEALLNKLETNPGVGMAAPLILRAGTDIIDSAGMLLARDGSSVQRGHGEPARAWAKSCEALFPSGCAAIYRCAMLMETGMFDEDLFLYHEDTDLGLRGQWLGWRCIYVPEAEVEHMYSSTVGQASEMKAWYVERNRLRTVWKLFPARDVMAAHFFALGRYFYHLVAALAGLGMAAQFKKSGQSLWKLPWLVFKAHLNLACHLGEVLRKRRQVQRRITASQFRAILARHRLGVREVAFH